MFRNIYVHYGPGLSTTNSPTHEYKTVFRRLSCTHRQPQHQKNGEASGLTEPFKHLAYVFPGSDKASSEYPGAKLDGCKDGRE